MACSGRILVPPVDARGGNPAPRTRPRTRPREVFEGAVKNNAAAIIVAHNHPSGDLKASQDDIEITKKLIHAGKILDIEVIDHIIVSARSPFFKSIN